MSIRMFAPRVGLVLVLVRVLSPVVARADDRRTGVPLVPVENGCERVVEAQIELDGVVGDLARNVVSNWVITAPAANPAMLAMFRDRDVVPYRDLLPWSGEFVGKHLTGACQIAAVTGQRGRERVAESLGGVVRSLLSHQDADGYLGPFPRAFRLTGSAPNVGGKEGPTWDAWGHYHVALGLLQYYELTRDPAALVAARRIGDLLCDRFLGAEPPARLVDTGSTEMNLAPAHVLCLLHQITGEPRYRDLAAQLVDREFSATNEKGETLAGDYLRRGRAGVPFYRLPKPRWESLHPIMALPELYRITGEGQYRAAFENLWWSIVETDRHNNGGFSSGEQAQGNPYHPGAIETCCTVAWMAMTVEMLRLNADSRIADELELSTLNSALGFWHRSGCWSTYNTPMEGVRRANFHEIVFQARPGSPELNCCSVNAPRGLGLIGQWALMRDPEGWIVNWFGPAKLAGNAPGMGRIAIEVVSHYPREGSIRMTIRRSNDRVGPFAIKLRIPQWSRATTIRVNGEKVAYVARGKYLSLEREWNDGDLIEIDLDMNLHFWIGDREESGRASLYRGPVLLAYDRRDHPEADDPPAVDLATLRLSPPLDGTQAEAVVLVDATSADRAVRLRDFASAGGDGSSYRTWLRIQNGQPARFDRARPLPTVP
jgi:DUF1680 family protein